MSDLGAWLREQIAEDEAVARDAYYDEQRWLPEEEAVIRQSDGDVLFTANRKSEAAHVALWDPARVLAECAAKRAVLDRMDKAGAYLQELGYRDTEQRRDGQMDYDHMRWVVKLWAKAYADRPGYNPAWTLGV